MALVPRAADIAAVGKAYEADHEGKLFAMGVSTPLQMQRKLDAQLFQRYAPDLRNR